MGGQQLCIARGTGQFTQTKFCSPRPRNLLRAARAVATVALQKVGGAVNLIKEGNQIRSYNSKILERD